MPTEPTGDGEVETVTSGMKDSSLADKEQVAA